MPKIVPIVEGDGEVTAVPILLHKLLKERKRYDIQVARPKNAHGRANLQKPDGLERFVKYAWKEPDCGAIVILLDAEEECPVEVAKDFSQRIKTMGVLQTVVIVCAARMYETWFLASLETLVGKELNGRAGLLNKRPPATDVESIKRPKSWINDCFPSGRAYKETEDQEALTQLIDLPLAHKRSRSFRRLCKAIDEVLEAIDSRIKIVTPVFADKSVTSLTQKEVKSRKRKWPGR